MTNEYSQVIFLPSAAPATARSRRNASERRWSACVGGQGGGIAGGVAPAAGSNTALIGPIGRNVGIGFAVASNRARAAVERMVVRRQEG